MIHIDGSFGESGGAMLRQAIGLSIITGKPFTMDNIRAGRPHPGLSMQHLTALNFAKEICSASVEGNLLGSTRVVFSPNIIKDEIVNKDIDIGTAGSITLFLQSVLLPAMFSGKEFNLRITGGTDVAWSIPIDYFINVLALQLRPYADINIRVINRGYYPKGDGCIEFHCKGKHTLINIHDAPMIFLEDTTQKHNTLFGISHASSSLKHSMVAERQEKGARLILEHAGIKSDIITEYNNTSCDGSGIVIWTEKENIITNDQNKDNKINNDKNKNTVILGSDCLGSRGKPAEDVGREAARRILSLIERNIPCDEHLADQLIPLLGLVGGEIITEEITGHIKSNIYVTERFLDVKFIINPLDQLISITNTINL